MLTIAEVAAKAVETPKECTELEVLRLGLWFVDHPEHVKRHKELEAAPMGRVLGPSILDRLAAQRPQPLSPERSVEEPPAGQEIGEVDAHAETGA